MRPSRRPEAAPPAQPPSSDSSWPRRCGPLLDYLATPRTWAELDVWASERGMSGSRLRNMLAWLESQGSAGTRGGPRVPAGAPPAPLGVWRRYGAATAG